jgi:hypothetical protein
MATQKTGWDQGFGQGHTGAGSSYLGGGASAATDYKSQSSFRDSEDSQQKVQENMPNAGVVGQASSADKSKSRMSSAPWSA